MMNPRSLVLSLSATGVAVLANLCIASPAYAGGFMTDYFGSDHGQPAISNVYSTYFNPAALAGMTGSDVTLEGVFGARSMSFNRSSTALSTPSCSSVPSCVQANTGQASLFNLQGAPFLGYATDFGGSKAHLGVAAYVPLGGQVTFNKASSIAAAPGAYDSTARWAGLNTTLSSLYLTAAFAYRIEAAHLGVGVSVSGIRSAVTTTRAQDLDGSDATSVGGKNVEGRSYLDVSGYQFGAAAGVYWEPTPQLHLGASYTSQPNFGNMRLSGTFQFYSPTTPIPQQNADLIQAYPDIVRVGGAWKVVPNTELRLDVTWERWSELTNQCVVTAGNQCTLGANGASTTNAVLINLPRNFQDTVKIRGGVGYWLQPQTELYGSVAFETSAAPSAYEDPLIFDSNHLIFTAGARHGFTDHIYVGGGLSYTYFLPITVTDSTLNTFAAPSKTPSENGSYSASLFVLNVAASYVW
jgi:long-chain fatty acid transport protein